MLPKRKDRDVFEAVLKFSLIVCAPLGFVSAILFPWYVSVSILAIGVFVMAHRLISRD